MGGLKVDFSEVEGGFAPIPEGRYECVIEKVEVRESNRSEHNYLNLELKITEDDYEDRRLFNVMSFHPNALPMVKDQLVELGVIEEDDELEFEWEDDVDIQPKEGPRLTEPELEGMAVTAVVSLGMYEGKERNQVDRLEAPESGAAKKKSSGNGKAPAKRGGKTKSSSAKSGSSRRKLR